MNVTTRFKSAARTLAGALLLATLAVPLPGPVRAMELIPSLGLTKSTDSNAGDAQGFGGLALRIPLSPLFKAEAGIAYRQDSYAGGSIKVRQWPVTASLWATPFPSIYAGAGVGWYRTTIDYPSVLPISDSTTRDLGAHVGGGVLMPLAPKLGLDLNGRYVFMSKHENSVDVPTTFNPDYWMVTAGLAVSF
jgi:hypothetical protein